MDERADRISGAIYGLLIGDALGVPYEFHNPKNLPAFDLIAYEPPSDFQRSHRGVPPGTWSDDGAQALCLLDSLTQRNEFNLIDFSQRLQNWYFDGYLAVDKNVFDVGIQTREAIKKLSQSYFPGETGRADEHANGNGSLMRALPLALWHQGSDEELIELAHQQSLVTHAHPRSQACCALYCIWARKILQNHVNPWHSAAETLRQAYRDRPEFSFELEDQIRPESPPVCEGTGYVVDCLHSARVACAKDSFESVIKRAIQFGNDTDTTACVAGGMAGLLFGFSKIPQHLIDGLRGKAIVEPLVERLTSPHQQ